MGLTAFTGDPSMAEQASWGAGAPSGPACISLGKSMGRSGPSVIKEEGGSVCFVTGMGHR